MYLLQKVILECLLSMSQKEVSMTEGGSIKCSIGCRSCYGFATNLHKQVGTG